MKNRIRTESFTTVTDSYLFRVPKVLFKEVMDEFDDFRNEVELISRQREWTRLARIQAFKLGIDEETFIGQHAIDKKNVAIMEERLAQDKPPIMTFSQIDKKLLKEKRARWYKIELLVTLRPNRSFTICWHRKKSCNAKTVKSFAPAGWLRPKAATLIRMCVRAWPRRR